MTTETQRKKGSKYLRVDQKLYQSQAFQTLPASAMKLWILLRMDFVPWRNGRILATLSTLRPKGWRSSDLLRRNLAVLVDRGLLAYTRKCPPNVFQRASMLRFTDENVGRDPAAGLEFQRATHDYLSWTPTPKPKTGKTKPFFAQSGIQIDAHPASGSKLIRHPDRGGDKLVRHPDRGETHLTARSGSGFSDSERSKVRDPAPGQTLSVVPGIAPSTPRVAQRPAPATDHINRGLLAERLAEFRRQAAA